MYSVGNLEAGTGIDDVKNIECMGGGLRYVE